MQLGSMVEVSDMHGECAFIGKILDFNTEEVENNQFEDFAIIEGYWNPENSNVNEHTSSNIETICVSTKYLTFCGSS